MNASRTTLLALPILLAQFLLCTTPLQAQRSFKLLALGDSYTIGESVAEASRWPMLLADSFAREGYGISQVDIIAKTGWRTDELIQAIEQEQPAKDYDFVTLLIGVNNQYQARGFEQFRDEFPTLLRLAIEHAGGKEERVTVVSIPDYAYTPFGESSGETNISKSLDLYNEEAKTTAEAWGVRFIDITPISREGLAQPELVAEDGLHPSEAQYARWVSLVFKELLPLVKQ